MFKGATAFNQDISNWKTAAVTDMGYMFNGAKAFSGDLSGWNVLEVFSQPNGCQNFCDKAGSLTPPGFFINFARAETPDAENCNRDPRPRRNRELARHAHSRDRQHPTTNTLYRFRT